VPKKPSKKKVFRKRSQAAKKGWATRRKKEELRGAINEQARKNEFVRKFAPKRIREKAKKVLSTKQPPKAVTPKQKRKQTVEELQAFANKQAAEIEALKSNIALLNYLSTFEDDIPDGYTKADGTLTVWRSRLRGHEKTEEWYNRLVDANFRGELDSEAKELAAETGMPLREVYSLFYSP